MNTFVSAFPSVPSPRARMMGAAGRNPFYRNNSTKTTAGDPAVAPGAPGAEKERSTSFIGGFYSPLSGFMLLTVLAWAPSCQIMGPLIDDLAMREKECGASGGVFILGRGCSMPTDPGPTDPGPEDTNPAGNTSPPPTVSPPSVQGDTCKALGHEDTAAFRKSLDRPARQFIVNPAETGSRTLASGRLTAEVTGFGALEFAERDSFLLIMETVRPGSWYKIVFSGDTWRQGGYMFTRWTAQHFPTGARTPRMEPMAQFERWLHPDSRYLYDCAWNKSRVTCAVHEIQTGWSVRTETPLLAEMGALTSPLVFGDMAHQAYQSMGPEAMVLRACISVF